MKQVEYLIRNKPKAKMRAHIWTGTDTACRMWSTGGLISRKGYSVHSTAEGRDICQMCKAATDVEPLREQLRQQLTPPA